MDPSLEDKKVTVQFENVTLEAGLHTILRSARVENHAVVYHQSKEPGKVGKLVIEKIYLKEKGTSQSAPKNAKASAEKPKGRFSFEKEPFFDKNLDRFVEVVKGEVMAVFKKGLTDEETEKVLKELDATVLKKNKLGAYRLKIPEAASVQEFIERYGNDERLKLIEPNFISSTLAAQTTTPNDPSFVSQWAIDTI